VRIRFGEPIEAGTVTSSDANVEQRYEELTALVKGEFVR
jgi:hypothetical protein